MSLNLDALTDETAVREEGTSRSSRKPESEDHIDEADADARVAPSDAGNGSITYLSLTRHIVFFVTLIGAAVAGYLFREEVMLNVGYGALPIGLWAVLFAYLLLTRTKWLAGRWRETISSLLIVVGGVAVLGIFDAPLGAASGDTYGGVMGVILAREPFEWYRYDAVLWHQVLAWARVAVLLIAGLAAQFPSAFRTVMRVLWIGSMMVMTGMISLFMMAGGAASSVASKRRNANTANATGANVAAVGSTNADATMNLEGDASISDPQRQSHTNLDDGEFTSEHLVGMGDTVYVEEDDKDVAAEVDEWLKAESDAFVYDAPQPDPAVSEIAAGNPMTIDPPAAEQNENRIVEVGVALQNEEESSASSDELLDPAAMVVESQVATAPESAELDPDLAPIIEPVSQSETIELVIEDTDSVLEQITSGATVEAAINAFPWHLPPIEYLASPPKGGVSTTEIKATSDLIEETLDEHGVSVSVDQVRVGPTVTMYGLKPGWKGGGPRSKSPAQRVRVDTILNREKDIALALSSPNIRFESVVAGSSFVGIEVPNAKPTPVNLRTVMESEQWVDFVDDAALPVPLGMGSGGDPVMADFSKMPHTLVAGATGSGKSVCMNTIVTGLLLTRTPIELRMVMIDPKRVELTPYQGIPHLYTPVIVEPELAVKALKALVKEMMDRFSTLEAAGVKNITSYNAKNNFKMPYLLILVDELADLMLTASNEVEQLLVRLAQLGRATGVHLVVATQRPSVDVVTGLIKANFPSRISFAVGSQVDSRTILDATGADRLLGKGDMLYKPIDLSQPVRVQGAFLAEDEIESVVDFWKDVGAPPMSQLDLDGDGDDESFSIPGLPDESDGGDALFMQASSMAKSQKTLSTSLLQRRLRIGYPRAARLMDELEDAGIVGPGEPGKPRQVIAN